MTVPNLLSALCSTDMPSRQHLETQQALFKQFAEIIDFTLKFDDLKVCAVSVQPSFCFGYREMSKGATTMKFHASLFFRSFIGHRVHESLRVGSRSVPNGDFYAPHSFTSFRCRSFSVTGPNAWNSLPEEL